MLVKPILSELMEHVDSKYTLVSISAKRARQIMAEENVLYDNPVSMALREIAGGEKLGKRLSQQKMRKVTDG